MFVSLWTGRGEFTGRFSALVRLDPLAVESGYDYSQTLHTPLSSPLHGPGSGLTHRIRAGHGSGAARLARRSADAQGQRGLWSRHLASRAAGQDLVRLLPNVQGHAGVLHRCRQTVAPAQILHGCKTGEDHHGADGMGAARVLRVQIGRCASRLECAGATG